MEDLLEEYILAHIDEEGSLLAELNRDTHVNVLRPRMLSGHLQGKILKMFCRMIQPKRVLELGTFTAYSALAMAEGLPADGCIHTIDNNEELEDFVQKHIQKSAHKDQIICYIGDALELIPTLTDTFDLVFIDADKREYLAYYHAVFDKVRKGGFIIADNTLWDKKVIEENAHLDEQTKGVILFNEYVAKDSRVEKVIIPLRDGLSILMKK